MLFNNNVKIIQTLKGKRLFATNYIGTGQTILKFSGILLSLEEMQKLDKSNADDLLQIGKNIFLNLKGDISYFINHSCNANSFVKVISKTAFLISNRNIKPNEEITIDYSITSDEGPDTWSMICNCGSWNCRATVSGFNTLSDKDKEIFIKQNIVPKYIRN